MGQSTLRPAVVLVADRTLSADYKALFEGIFATMQTTKVPETVMRRFVAPPAKTDVAGRAVTAPLGLRRVEASLRKHLDLSHDDIVCTTPEKLPALLGSWVKVVAFSSSDPLGFGMSNTTTTQFWSGELYTRRFTRELLSFLLDAKQKHDFKVVGGGAGAWQWQLYDDDTAKACLDCVYEDILRTKGRTCLKRFSTVNRSSGMWLPQRPPRRIFARFMTRPCWGSSRYPAAAAGMSVLFGGSQENGASACRSDSIRSENEYCTRCSCGGQRQRGFFPLWSGRA